MPSKNFENLVAQFRANPIDFSKSIADLRQGSKEMGLAMIPPRDASFIKIEANGVRAEWTRVPESDNSAVILYLHGGGYILGTVEEYRDFIARLCKAGHVQALSADYRLAPENRFPAAINDAVNTYKWLLSQNIEPNRIIIAGDSAGGGLTLAALLALRDEQVRLPAAAICLSPCTDLAQTGDSIKSKASVDPFLSSEFLSFCYDRYLGVDEDRRNPLASPLYADLTGLPPLLIMVGTSEILLDDSIRFAAKARNFGVPVELVVAEKMIHVWPTFAGIIPEGQESVTSIGHFIRKHL